MALQVQQMVASFASSDVASDPGLPIFGGGNGVPRAQRPAAMEEIGRPLANRQRIIGFGHRFHRPDPFPMTEVVDLVTRS